MRFKNRKYIEVIALEGSKLHNISKTFSQETSNGYGHGDSCCNKHNIHKTLYVSLMFQSLSSKAAADVQGSRGPSDC